MQAEASERASALVPEPKPPKPKKKKKKSSIRQRLSGSTAPLMGLTSYHRGSRWTAGHAGDLLTPELGDWRMALWV